MFAAAKGEDGGTLFRGKLLEGFYQEGSIHVFGNFLAKVLIINFLVKINFGKAGNLYLPKTKRQNYFHHRNEGSSPDT